MERGMNMKKLLPVIAAGLFFSCAGQPDTEPLVAVEVVEVEEKEPVLVEKEIEETIYVVTREVSYYSDGIMDTEFIGTYDDEGIPLELTTYSANGDVRERLVYKKDGDKLISTSYDQGGEILDQVIIQYGQYGWVDQETVQTGEGEIMSISRYEYNNLGQPVVWKAFDGNDTLLANTIYSYDENNRKIKTEFFDSTGTNTGWIDHNYQEDKLIEEIYYLEMGDIDKRTLYEYENDQLVKTLYYAGEKALRRQETYENDPEGNPVRTNYLDKRGNLLEYKTRTFEPRTLQKIILVWE